MAAKIMRTLPHKNRSGSRYFLPCQNILKVSNIKLWLFPERMSISRRSEIMKIS